MQEQLPTTAWMQEVEQCRSNCRDCRATDVATEPFCPGGGTREALLIVMATDGEDINGMISEPIYQPILL